MMALAFVALSAVAAVTSLHGAAIHDAAQAATLSVAGSHPTSGIIMPWMW
jgi:hypothetical protein